MSDSVEVLIDKVGAIWDTTALREAVAALRARCEAAEAEIVSVEREREAAADLATAQRDRAKAAERTLEAERGVVIACISRAEAAERSRDEARAEVERLRGVKIVNDWDQACRERDEAREALRGLLSVTPTPENVIGASMEWAVAVERAARVLSGEKEGAPPVSPPAPEEDKP